MKLLFQLLLIGAAFYVSFALFLYLAQRRFIFFPIRTKHKADDEDISFFELEREEATLRGWLLNERFAGERLLYYFGGNSEDVYYSRDQFASLADTAVLLVNYRGYGVSTGKPGEKELFADSLAIVDAINEKYRPASLFLMGRSLGSSIAAYAASRRDIAGIILVTPFDSLETLAKKQYPFMPVSLILRHKFRSADSMRTVRAPALILYGGRDRIVPPEATERLIRSIQTEKSVVHIDEAEHNTIELFDEYQLAILRFIAGANQRQDQ